MAIQLHLAVDDLHKSLPPSVSSASLIFHEEHDVLGELDKKMRDIEAQIQDALIRAVNAQEEEEGGENETVQDALQPHAAEVASISSGTLGLSLAMEVNETTTATEDEGDEPLENPTENIHRGEKETTLASKESVEKPPYTLEQFYVNLDTMEDYLEQHPEQLPFEGLEEKREVVQVHGFCLVMGID